MLTQLGVVYSIPYPPLYTNLLSWIGVLQLDLINVLPIGCIASVSFHTSLLVRTLALPAFALVPLALRAFGATQWVELCKGVLFYALFLIYPSTSAAPTLPLGHNLVGGDR